MKVLVILLFGLLPKLSEQSFVWAESPKPQETKPANAAGTERFIVNIIEYQYLNTTTNVKTPNKFRCIGTLVSEEFVLTTATCAKTPPGTHLGVQFMTLREDTNEPGYSLTFDTKAVIIHHDYKDSDKEMNNIALIKFNADQVSTDPPLFQVFKPRAIGAIPTLAQKCSIMGRDVHLANVPSDELLVIGAESCHGKGGRQAFCSILEDKEADVCKAVQGAPVTCKDHEISGFVLNEAKACTAIGGKYQLRFHSIGTFNGWIKYWMYGPQTEKPNSASGVAKSSLAVMLMSLLWFFAM